MAVSKVANRLSTQVSNFKERLEANRLARKKFPEGVHPNAKKAIQKRGLQGLVQYLEEMNLAHAKSREVTLTLGQTRKVYSGLTAEKLRYGKLRRISLASGLRQKSYNACLNIIGEPKFINHITFGSGIKTRRFFLETIAESLLKNEERFWKDMSKIVGIKANRDGKLIINVYDARTITPEIKTKPSPHTTFEVQLNLKEIKQFYDYADFTNAWHKELNEYLEGVWEIH